MKQNPRKMLQLLTRSGQKKYLTESELGRLLKAAESVDRKTRMLCLCLAFSGCRITEALQLTADRIDLEQPAITFRSLKKGNVVLHRTVPVPSHVTDAINLVFGIGESQIRDRGSEKHLWPWSRTTAWRHVKQVMKSAGIIGPQASPMGIRHGFGVLSIQAGVPINILSKWMGHADISMTAVYADAMGEEEREIAGKLWRRMPSGELTGSGLPLFKQSNRANAENAL